MINQPTIPIGSLFLAPMEGITDESYRLVVEQSFGGWDFYGTDFLRVPAAGRYPRKYLLDHFGKTIYQSSLKDKTFYQILTSYNAFTEEILSDLNELSFDWIDLNLGCPSKTVCKNGGGSSLLRDLPRLTGLIKLIRKNVKGFFSVKVRIGYHDGNDFVELIKMLNDQGAQLITVHARTRDQMYKEPADWSYIKSAVEHSKVPIIGNGDLWNQTDIKKMFEQTGCHGVMLGRGAMKQPWIAQHYKNKTILNQQDIIQHIFIFFKAYIHEVQKRGIFERGLVKQLKSLSRFMFEDLIHGEILRREILLSHSSVEILEKIKTIAEKDELSQMHLS